MTPRGLIPVRRVEGHVATDCAKVRLVAGHQGGADAARRERNQDVKCQLPHLGHVVMLASSDAFEDLGRFDPLPLRRRNDPTPPFEIMDELAFAGGASSAKEFMENDGRASGDERRLQELLGESAGLEDLDVDRRVEDREPSPP